MLKSLLRDNIIRPEGNVALVFLVVRWRVVVAFLQQRSRRLEKNIGIIRRVGAWVVAGPQRKQRAAERKKRVASLRLGLRLRPNQRRRLQPRHNLAGARIFRLPLCHRPGLPSIALRRAARPVERRQLGDTCRRARARSLLMQARSGRRRRNVGLSTMALRRAARPMQGRRRKLGNPCRLAGAKILRLPLCHRPGPVAFRAASVGTAWCRWGSRQRVAEPAERRAAARRKVPVAWKRRRPTMT